MCVRRDRPSWQRYVPAAAVLVLSLVAGCGIDRIPSNPAGPIDEAPPLVPTGFQVTATSDNKFVLSWLDNTEADLAGYRVYRYDPRTEMVSSLTPHAPLTTPSITVAGTYGETYYFRFSAVDASNNESALSPSFQYLFDATRQQASVPGSGGDGPRFPEEPSPDHDDLPASDGRIE
ncbi:MAG: hypothetical protein QUU85_18905 [Candidatus Eisenbacteria bacterium]|nr:hypothetical protein [Candidatus Eisenbacteria bacterium]